MDDPTGLRTYLNGPMFEVGLNLIFAGKGLVDPYDIRALHDEYRDEFPGVERHLPATVGGRPINIASPDDDYQRWFFISSDGHSLVQFQTDLIGRNWRRQTLPPDGDLASYPGFDGMLLSFRKQFETLRTYLASKAIEMPPCHLAELFYDNFIPLEEGVRVKDVLTAIQVPYKTSVNDLVCSWQEGLVGPPSEHSHLRIDMRVVGAAINGGEARNFARLRMAARDEVKSYEEASAFYEQAHALIRTRLDVLTTDTCRANW